MEFEKKMCPIVNVDGLIASGKQYDIDITLPEDNRGVIYGVIKDMYKEPICDAVVKLVEVVHKDCKCERRPVSHTFTDKEGEFVFGPLCPNKFYEIQVWVDRVQHIKVCAKCKHEGKCLRGEKIKCHDFTMDKCEKYEEYDKHDKCDKCEKHEKCDKCEEHEKCDKFDKCTCKI